MIDWPIFGGEKDCLLLFDHWKYSVWSKFIIIHRGRERDKEREGEREGDKEWKYLEKKNQLEREK